MQQNLLKNQNEIIFLISKEKNSLEFNITKEKSVSKQFVPKIIDD